MNPDLLSQLRDIHAAQAAPWWPPAPGWWVLALLALAALAWCVRLLFRGLRVLQRRRRMLAWIDHLNATIDPEREPQAYLATLNRVFKLVAMRAFPDDHCAAMAGADWERFLREKIKDSQAAGPLAALAEGPYDPAPGFDPAGISELARQWIRQYG